jgi:hypothetical protein
MNEYPTQTELLTCLTNIANVAGDTTNVPFRVDVIPLHGKPPMYSVMIKSPPKICCAGRSGRSCRVPSRWRNVVHADWQRGGFAGWTRTEQVNPPAGSPRGSQAPSGACFFAPVTP